MKRIKVLIFWVFLVATALTGWKVIFPKKNKLPEKLFVKTKKRDDGEPGTDIGL